MSKLLRKIGKEKNFWKAKKSGEKSKIGSTLVLFYCAIADKIV